MTPINMKKFIILLLLIFLSGCAKPIIQTPIEKQDMVSAVESFNLNGKSLVIANTDDNKDETLIIKTDTNNYLNIFGNFNVIFSVYNNSGTAQDVDVLISMGGENKGIGFFGEYTGTKTTITTIPGYETKEIKTSTTTIPATTVKEQTIISTTTLWTSKTMEDFKTEISKDITRKSIGETKPIKSFKVSLKANEQKFFKANLVSKDEAEEFYIEAIGAKGAYGHLDPWAYEQSFDSLADGALAGQDSWTKGAATAGTVQATTIFGTSGKAVYSGNSGSSNYRTVTDITDGTIYFAARFKSSNNNQSGAIILGDNNSKYVASINAQDSAGLDKIQYLSSSGWNNVWFNLAVNTWYVFSIQFDTSANTVVYGYKTVGGSWTYTATLTTYQDASSVDMFRWNEDTTNNSYFDEISASDPDAPAVAAVIKPYVPIIIFDE